MMAKDQKTETQQLVHSISGAETRKNPESVNFG
jgi:hypothetical protein